MHPKKLDEKIIQIICTYKIITYLCSMKTKNRISNEQRISNNAGNYCNRRYIVRVDDRKCYICGNRRNNVSFTYICRYLREKVFLTEKN